MKKWAAEFKRGRDSIEDDGRSGRPKDATADENVRVVHILVMCDRRRDLQSIALYAVYEYLGDQEKAFYFEGIRKLEQRWAKCIALKGDYIEN